MAWVKIPAEHHALFLAAVPKHPKVTTLKMFGGIAAKANGQMFAGLFAKSFIVKLSDKDRDEAMQLDGAEPFDPMGNGRTMSNTILMPEETFGDDAELKAWLSRALDYTLTLPAKAATSKDKPVAAPTTSKDKPAGKGPAPKAASAKTSSTKSPPAKPTTTKAPAKAKPAAKKR